MGFAVGGGAIVQMHLSYGVAPVVAALVGVVTVDPVVASLGPDLEQQAQQGLQSRGGVGLRHL